MNLNKMFTNVRFWIGVFIVQGMVVMLNLFGLYKDNMAAACVIHALALWITCCIWLVYNE